MYEAFFNKTKLIAQHVKDRVSRYSYFPKYSFWAFAALFVIISICYHYDEILFFNPQSTHQYRQTDCLSITANYYHEDLNFFTPSIHNLISDNGKTGYTIGEFPLLYYAVAGLWKIFGPHEFIYRLLVVLLAFLGLLALFKIFEDLFQDTTWALVLSLLMFTFPIYAYYANNFLTNLPALNLAFIGWYFLYRFYQTSRSKYFFTGALCFLLGGLLKITALISFLALFGLFVFEVLNFKHFGKKGKLFPKPLIQVLPFLIVFTGIIGWFKYVKYFNNIHGGKYTFNSIWPIWDMNAEMLKATYESISHTWWYEYFSFPLFLFVTGGLVLVFVRFRKQHSFLSWTLTISLFGAFMYLILWFNALKNHDYYVLNLLVIPALIFATSGCYLKKCKPRIFNNGWVKILLLLFLGYNVAYCSSRMEKRYWGFWNNCWGQCDLYGNDEFAEIKPKLRGHGITRNDTVISIPDRSFNISLYLMDVNGYTNMGNNFDSSLIADRMKNGAAYLVISDSALYKQEYIRTYAKHKLLSHDNVDVYDLKPIRKEILSSD